MEIRTDVADWRAQAGCRDEDPDLWFPDGATGHWAVQAEDAKAVCRRCPVMETCLQWALETGQQAGIWGGTTEKDRANLRRRTARNAAQQPRAPRTTRTPATVLADRTAPSTGDHIVWTGSSNTTIAGATYTPTQLAWHVAYGARPLGRLVVDCGHKGCVTAAHLVDTGLAPDCGSRRAYQAHLARGETPCTPCRQANTDADRRLRNTGTTKTATPERSAV